MSIALQKLLLLFFIVFMFSFFDDLCKTIWEVINISFSYLHCKQIILDIKLSLKIVFWA